MADLKSFKDYCKEAKKRLKSGFWQDYQKQVSSHIQLAEQQGISTSKVKEYYEERLRGDIIKSQDKNEDFYLKVKALLDSEGEVSDALGRLTDMEYYKTLSYEEKQRYNLELSQKYLKAVERYKKEKLINVN